MQVKGLVEAWQERSGRSGLKKSDSVTGMFTIHYYNNQ